MQNKLLAVKALADQLLAKMNLAQKVGQMTQAEYLSCSPDDVKKYHLGSVMSGAGSNPGSNTPQDWIDINDSYWMASMEQDDHHLAIPIIYGVDAIHGHNNVLGATIFPHNIGLGAANDVDLTARIAQATAKEVRATGLDWVFAPNLAVASDIHWGRTYESFSQNPDQVARYAGSIVSALQQDLIDNGVVCCVKHFVGDGGAAHGISQGDTQLSYEQLAETHIKPFYPAIDAGALAVMVSFSSWNGEKCHGHRYLITDLLKQQMNFNGLVISDMGGIDYLSDDYYSAVAKGVNAGIDMFMVPQNWRLFIEHLINHVEFGTVSMNRINDAVHRILSVKLAAGLFSAIRPKRREWVNNHDFGGDKHRALAREAVRKSLVLLKNDKFTLPLNKQANILVTGKNAHNRGHQCGGYTIDWQGVSGNEQIVCGHSIFEGISNVAPNAYYVPHNELSNNSVKSPDVAVVVIGETPYAEGLGDIRQGDDIIIEVGSQVNGEISILSPYGNSLKLSQLHPEDLDNIQFLHEKNIPVVVILVSGRPLIVNAELELASAFVAAWLPGSEGQGVSDVLFGDYNFSGKLSFSWPKNTLTQTTAGCQTQIINETLFPIGYGLRY
jgi:beta-glucosidase